MRLAIRQGQYALVQQVSAFPSYCYRALVWMQIFYSSTPRAERVLVFFASCNLLSLFFFLFRLFQFKRNAHKNLCFQMRAMLSFTNGMFYSQDFVAALLL